MKAQPAKVSYFFEKGYQDVRNAIAYSWRAVVGPRKEQLAEIFSKNFFPIAVFSALFYIIVFTFMAIIGSVVSVVISAFLVTFFVIVMSVIYVLFMIAKLIDFLFCLVYRMYNKCPSCQQKFMHPVYLCPSCYARHDRLVPSKYGILYRTCNCGKKIPTTFFNGRQKLPAICPHCSTGKNTIAVEQNSRDLCCIPIIGGKNAGKTSYIVAAIESLQKTFTANNDLKCDLLYGINSDFQKNMMRRARGERVDVTHDMRMNYYRFAVYKEGQIKNIVSLCDVGGEAFSASTSAQNITDQIGLRYADGLIMLIDPLAIDNFRKSLPVESFKAYGGSDKPIAEVLNIVINTLENMLRLSYKDKIKTSIAIVFSKGDMTKLQEQIGESVVQTYMNAHKVSYMEAQNQVCIDFLRRNGEENYVNSLLKRFENVQFFVASAFGHNEENKMFVAKGVQEPVLWLLSRNNPPKILEAYIPKDMK